MKVIFYMTKEASPDVSEIALLNACVFLQSCWFDVINAALILRHPCSISSGGSHRCCALAKIYDASLVVRDDSTDPLASIIHFVERKDSFVGSLGHCYYCRDGQKLLCMLILYDFNSTSLSSHFRCTRRACRYQQFISFFRFKSGFQ